MHGEEPMMLEIVAVGAIAITLLLRIPCFAILSRTIDQSILLVLGTSTDSPLSFQEEKLCPVAVNHDPTLIRDNLNKCHVH